MTVDLLCFGILKDYFRGERDRIELADGASVGELVALLRERAENPSSIWNSLAVAVNREYATVGTVLKEGDEVALLPPVSGGSGVLWFGVRHVG